MTARFLVNVSRGQVIDESEVLVALRENRLDGVALDVFEREPPMPGNDLLKHPKTIVTPHVGAFTVQAFESASNASVGRLLEFVEGRTPAATLPIAAGWFPLSVAK
jgi:phosphoglycerate dehydrogenase-like enzyme